MASRRLSEPLWTLRDVPWQRIEATIMMASRDIRRLYDERLGKVGVNLTEATMLTYIAQEGPVSQTRLAEAMGMGRPSTGTRVAQLERRSLVTRSPDPDDARALRVSVTTIGRRLVRRIIRIDITTREDVRAGLSRDERRHLADVLDRVRQNTRPSQASVRVTQMMSPASPEGRH